MVIEVLVCVLVGGRGVCMRVCLGGTTSMCRQDVVVKKCVWQYLVCFGI